MSLNPRDLTQGGQVAFMRLKMFLQINNLISYYVLIGTALFALAVLLMRMSFQNMYNGTLYWYARVLSPLTSKMVNPPSYTIRYYEHRLKYNLPQLLSDNYTVYCGQLLKQELIVAGCAALLVAFLATLAVYWYLGRTGRRQSEDEVIGGRVLSESPKDVARLMKKRGEASDIRIDELPLKLDSEIQNLAMHGTVSTGKSTLMRKIMKQLRDRGDLVIVYDKGCTFVEDFYDESRDEVLNALDARCPNWDLWEECRTIAELENTSSTLIPASSGKIRSGREAPVPSLPKGLSACARMGIAVTTNFCARCSLSSWTNCGHSWPEPLPPHWLTVKLKRPPSPFAAC